ncbi:hypothetical protein D3C86_283760 [compost metagenome]
MIGTKRSERGRPAGIELRSSAWQPDLWSPPRGCEPYMLQRRWVRSHKSWTCFVITGTPGPLLSGATSTVLGKYHLRIDGGWSWTWQV